MHKSRRVMAHVKLYVMQVLESLAHCAPDFIYTEEVVIERLSFRCPDYIPDWLMDSGAAA